MLFGKAKPYALSGGKAAQGQATFAHLQITGGPY
jgi:hypothetical protein